MTKPKKKKANLKDNSKIKETASVSIEAHKSSASLLVSLIIFVMAFGLYIQTLPYEYVLDDQIVLTDNQYTNKGFAGIWDILTTESFAGYFGEQKDLLPGARYRPLSIVTFAVEHQLVGQNSSVSHFINTLLYAFLCVLIYFTLLKVFDSRTDKWYFSIPFIATLLYTIHPLHTEVVANVKGRDEILAMFFSIAALWTLFKSIEGRRFFWLTLSGFFFFIGLLAKENTLTFLAIIPLTVFVFRKQSIKPVLSSLAIYLFILGLYLLMRYNIIGYLLDSGKVSNDIMNNPFIDMSISEKYATIMYTLGHYLQLNIFPHPLTHDYYPFQIPTMDWAKPGTIISTLLYLVLIGASLYGLIKKRVWSYGILFYLIALSIVSNIIINVGATMNERFVFMASLGICITIAYFIVDYLPNRKRVSTTYLSYGFLALFIIGFTYQSISRIPVWRNPETLNAAAVKVSTNSARANSFMATALYDKIQKGSLSQAEKELAISEADFYANRSINIFPAYTNGNLMKAGISAEKYKLSNDLDVLLQDFKSVAIRRPDIKFLHEYFEYLNRNQDSNKLYDFYYDVGYKNLFKSGQYQWALTYLNYAYQLNQNGYEVNQGLSETYNALRQTDKASEFGYRAQNLRPNG